MYKEQKDNVKKWLIFLGAVSIVTMQRTILKGIWVLLLHLQKLREMAYFLRNASALNKNKVIKLQTQSNGSKTYLYNSD